MERIICAAIWYDDGIHRPHLPKNIITGIVIGGLRHCNCMTAIVATLYPYWQVNDDHNKMRIEVLNKIEEGFLTSTGRYLDRENAARIAIEARQIEKLNYSSTELFSEDLY